MQRESGFTLLEMMMVLLLLGVMARLVIGMQPSSPAPSVVKKVHQAARWAAEQAQLEGRIYRMELDRQNWQISALGHGEDGEKGPLPGTVWYPVSAPLASGLLTEGQLEAETVFPFSIWFAPGGEMTPVDVVFQEHGGLRHYISLSPDTIWRTDP